MFIAIGPIIQYFRCSWFFLVIKTAVQRLSAYISVIAKGSLRKSYKFVNLVIN